MRAVLTRVSTASVAVDGKIVGAIDCPDTGGVLALVGIAAADDPAYCGQRTTEAKIEKMADKIARLRILEQERSLSDIGAPLLLVSQFTLYGDTARGRRPSWSAAASAAVAEPLFESLVQALLDRGLVVERGCFGAKMQVTSVNEGPFTLLVET